MEINLDFDGTCVTHSFPKIGKEIGAIPVLKRLVAEGHRLILFTMRSDMETPPQDPNQLVTEERVDFLQQAVNWFKNNGIPLYGIQANPTQHKWTKSPKSYAPLMIDDSSLGCPLKEDPRISHRPFVDWEKVEEILEEKRILINK